MNDSKNDSTLRVENVTKRFGSGETEITAVRDVSLSVAPGEVVLIMGPLRFWQEYVALDAGSAAKAHCG